MCGMRIRHVIALVPAALLLLTGCSDSEDTAASAPNSSSVQAATNQDDAVALNAAVKEMCCKVSPFLDNPAS